MQKVNNLNSVLPNEDISIEFEEYLNASGTWGVADATSQDYKEVVWLKTYKGDLYDYYLAQNEGKAIIIYRNKRAK